MLRVLAALRKNSFCCEEMFYAVCPSLPLAIAALRPRRVGCNSQSTVTMIQSTFKRTLPLILVCLRSNKENSSGEAHPPRLPVRAVRYGRRHSREDCQGGTHGHLVHPLLLPIRAEDHEGQSQILPYGEDILFQKLIEEDHPMAELWATLMGAPLPAHHFLHQLGEHIYVKSNQEVIVAVVKKDRVVTLQAIQSPCRKSVNLIVKRHRDMAEFLSFYSYICSGLNRHVLDKLVKRLTKHFNVLKM